MMDVLIGNSNYASLLKLDVYKQYKQRSLNSTLLIMSLMLEVIHVTAESLNEKISCRPRNDHFFAVSLFRGFKRNGTE